MSDAAAIAGKQIIATTMVVGTMDACARSFVGDDMPEAADGTLWRACLDVDGRGEPVTPLAVSAAAKQRGESARLPGHGTVGALTDYCAQHAVAPAQFAQAAAILRAHVARMKIQREALALMEAAKRDKPVSDLAAEAQHLATHAQALAAGPETKPTDPITMCLEGVKPEPVTWLWTGRLAVGKVTVLDGAPGSGKSTMTCDAAARVSRGLAFPHDHHARSAGGVIFVAGEDGVADTVVPRLLTAGADLSKCFVWPASQLPYLPDAAAAIAAEIKRRQAKLLILDPISALFARDLSANSDQDVRLALTPLAAAAEEFGCSVLLLRHLNKRTGASAFDRGGGSVGIGALARVVLLVARDHADPDLRILATVKANLTKTPRSLQVRIVDVGGVGRVDYGDECDVTADSLVTEPKPERKGKTDGAAEWLRQNLIDGQWHRQKQIEFEAKAAGIALPTLRRGRESIGVACRQMDGGWWWRLPDDQPSPVGHVVTWSSDHVPPREQERNNNNRDLALSDDQMTTRPAPGHEGTSDIHGSPDGGNDGGEDWS